MFRILNIEYLIDFIIFVWHDGEMLEGKGWICESLRVYGNCAQFFVEKFQLEFRLFLFGSTMENKTIEIR